MTGHEGLWAALEACMPNGVRKSNGKPGGFKATCPTHDDRQASLSVWADADGAIEITCHAGCDSDAIISALGFEWQDRLPVREPKTNGHAEPTSHTLQRDVLAPHPPIEYLCEDGNGTVWTHIRTGAKEMRWKPVGAGSGDRFYVPRPMAGGGTLYITEGEKDADALAVAGIPVVGLAGGASSTPSADALDRAVGTAAGVVLWPDADPPGMKFMNRVGQMLNAMGHPVAYLTPDPAWPKGWGAADIAYPGVSAYDLHVAVATGTEPVFGGMGRLTAESSRIAKGVPPVSRLVAAPSVSVSQLGTTGWTVRTSLADFTFRNVVTHRDLSADVTVSMHGEHVLRTPTTLGLAGRKSFTEAVRSRAQGTGTPEEWNEVVHAAFEGVMAATERIAVGDDVRGGSATDISQRFVVSPIWATGATMLVAPGELGKSTIARALMVSIASGREVIPGLAPQVTGPVMYLASEDAIVESHRNKIEAICRGVGIDRTSIPFEMRFVASRGRPLHRIANHVSEAATGFAGVILDAMQGLLAAGDDVRNEAAIFWNAVDDIGVPVFVVSHPNKATSQQWGDSDGRAAGAEVNRDRARMTWKATMSDLPSVAGTWTAAIRLENTKNNDGPRLDDVMLHRTWTPSEVTFSRGHGMGAPAATVSSTKRPTGRPPKDMQETIEAWERGAKTAGQMAKALGVPYDTAKSRIRRAKEAGHILDEDG